MRSLQLRACRYFGTLVKFINRCDVFAWSARAYICLPILVGFFFRLNFEIQIGNAICGLGSGEALVHRVRDAKTEEFDESKNPNAIKIIDPGISDKRVLIQESEFVSVLKIAGKEGNILSPILRAAWDGDDLQNAVKGNPAFATKPHISMIGHITPGELKKHLARVDMTNGFANRFAWCLSTRPKKLALGGNFEKINFTPLVIEMPVCCFDPQNS